MTACAIAIGLALVFFATTGGSIGGLGLLLAVLICPLTMGAVMWFLMGSQRQAGAARSHDPTRDAEALDAPTLARR